MSQRSTTLIALAAASAEGAVRRFVAEPVGGRGTGQSPGGMSRESGDCPASGLTFWLPHEEHRQ